MEWTVKVTIAPTVHESSYAARLFISGDDGERHIDTEQIWETSIEAIHPDASADARIFAMSLLNEMVNKLGPDAILGNLAGANKRMDDLFAPRQLFLT